VLIIQHTIQSPSLFLVLFFLLHGIFLDTAKYLTPTIKEKDKVMDFFGGKIQKVKKKTQKIYKTLFYSFLVFISHFEEYLKSRKN
jgi:hypothetical protein